MIAFHQFLKKLGTAAIPLSLRLHFPTPSPHTTQGIPAEKQKEIHSQRGSLIIVLILFFVECYEICHSTWAIIINPMQPLCKWPGTIADDPPSAQRLTSVTMKQYLANVRTFQQKPEVCSAAPRSLGEPRGSESAESRTPWQQAISHLPPELLCTLVCFRSPYCGKWAGLNTKQEEMFIIAAQHSVTFSPVQQRFRCREREGSGEIVSPCFFFFFPAQTSPACSQRRSVISCAC